MLRGSGGDDGGEAQDPGRPPSERSRHLKLVSAGGVPQLTPAWQCRRVRALVSALLDGEGSELDRMAVERHLSECESCREFAAFAQAAQELARLQASTADGAHVVSIKDLRASARQGRRSADFRHHASGVIAGAFLVLVIVFGIQAWSGYVTDRVAGGRGVVTHSLALPAVTATRTLDPGYQSVTERALIASANRRVAEAEYRERFLLRQPSLSHYDAKHYRPLSL